MSKAIKKKLSTNQPSESRLYLEVVMNNMRSCTRHVLHFSIQFKSTTNRRQTYNASNFVAVHNAKFDLTELTCQKEVRATFTGPLPIWQHELRLQVQLAAS